ncbi:MAG: hypothetical protein M1820_000151 [Bogoriella megaspora]|nr:MAG: hypothetical protein M1820_000151 [Bogoriella megaspora]
MATSSEDDPWLWSTYDLCQNLGPDSRILQDEALQSLAKDPQATTAIQDLFQLRGVKGKQLLQLADPTLLIARPNLTPLILSIVTFLRQLSGQYRRFAEALEDDVKSDSSAQAGQKRSSETIIKDAAGNKRRRIAPTLVNSSLETTNNAVSRDAVQFSPVPTEDLDPFIEETPVVLNEDDDFSFCQAGKIPFYRRRLTHSKFRRLLLRDDIIPLADAVASLFGGELVLPALGDSDHEDEPSEPDDASEIPEEEEDDAEDENACIQVLAEEEEKLRQTWHELELPKLERVARKTYFQGGKVVKRSQLVLSARKELAHFQQRLSKIKAQILDTEERRAEAIRPRCASMEVTIFSILETEWKIALWQRPQEPAPISRDIARPPFKKRTVQPKAPRVELHNTPVAEDGDQFVVPNGTRVSEHEEQSLKPSRSIVVDETLYETLQDEAQLSDRFALTDDWPPPRDSPSESPHEFGKTLEIGDHDDEEVSSNNANERDDSPRSYATAVEDTPDRPRRKSFEVPEIIDLLSSSPAPAGPAKPDFSQDPLKASLDEILAWSWEDLMEHEENVRITMKTVLEELTEPQRQLLRELGLSNRRDFLVGGVREVLNNLKSSEPATNAGLLANMAERAYNGLVLLARLYVCYFAFDKQYIQDIEIPSIYLDDITSDCYYEEKEDFDRFTDKLARFLSKLDKEQPPAPATPQKQLLTIKEDSPEYDTSEYDEEADDRRAGRARKTKDSQATQLQSSAHKRADKAEKAKSKHSIRITIDRQVTDQPGSHSDLIINPLEAEDHGPISINQHVARKMKQYQVEGVQFMWREVVAVGHEEHMQGCLLAHVMGLGKSLQAITLLVTIAEASHSNVPNIRDQIPTSLRESRTLVLCPASILHNWVNEFKLWVPEHAKPLLGRVRALDPSKTPLERLQQIQRWHEFQGVLITSYEMFRGLTVEHHRSSKKGRELVNFDFRKILLQSPNIIVADEAHMLRNNESIINNVTAQFRSRSRIALTGSPLNNNLDEVYAMINWVAPGYLDTLEYFRARFQNPIQNGLYVDSDAKAKRSSRQKLQVLMKEIAPKVDRKDITVLKHTLKPKNEFVIRIPLTQFQEDTYRMLMKHFMGSVNSETSNMLVFSWLHLLSLLCNHPSCLREKLLENKEDTKKNPKTQSTESTDGPSEHSLATIGSTEESIAAAADQHVSKMGITPELIREQIKHFAKLPADARTSAKHSYKTSLLLDILRLSKSANESVLIFSHHLPTIKYLQDRFRDWKLRFTVITGAIAASERQNIANMLNDGKFDILLVSTRAGGMGFNLVGASRVIIFDFSFNPAWEDQAIARAYRIGQTKPVFVYRFVAGGTFEEEVYNKAVFKTQLASRVVDRKNVASQAYKAKDLLFEPRTCVQKELELFIGKDPLVLDHLLQAEHCPIRSIVAMETLQAEEELVLDKEDQEEIDRLNKEQDYQRAQEKERRNKAREAQRVKLAFKKQEKSRDMSEVDAAGMAGAANLRRDAILREQRRKMKTQSESKGEDSALTTNSDVVKAKPAPARPEPDQILGSLPSKYTWTKRG